MNREQYDHSAHELGLKLPSGPRVAVIGSASFWGEDSGAICEALASELATQQQLVLLTGGVTGVGESFGKSFFKTRKRSKLPPNVFHILPHGSRKWNYGVTLFAGDDMGQRREILGRLANVYLSIEGGPGTEHEAEVAQDRGAAIVPVGRTGGFSGEAYPRLSSPRADLESQWKCLNDRDVGLGQLAIAVRQLVDALA